MVLGAGPSAVFVAWTPPGLRNRHVRAVPVADEPDVFWDGADAESYVERWRAEFAVGDDLGRFALPAGLNGAEGRWTLERLLEPLGLRRDEVWCSDVSDVYRMSPQVQRDLEEVYEPLARDHGWPSHTLVPMPAEAAAVRDAVQHHDVRLRAELAACRPEVVITLGNVAGRVVAGLAGDGFRRLEIDRYGRRREVVLEGREMGFLPLTEPEAPGRYQDVHRDWMERAELA